MVKFATMHIQVDEARGPISEHMEMVPIKDLLDVHLDYALATLMSFDQVVLDHFAGLRPGRVLIRIEGTESVWSPTANLDDANQAAERLAPSNKTTTRTDLESILVEQYGQHSVEIPILSQHGIPSPYSKQPQTDKRS